MRAIGFAEFTASIHGTRRDGLISLAIRAASRHVRRTRLCVHSVHRSVLPHRSPSRGSAADRALDQKTVDDEFVAKDILTNCRLYPKDEAPAAYKNLDAMLDSVKLAGLASEVARLKARFVIKDADTSLKSAAWPKHGHRVVKLRMTPEALSPNPP